MGTMEPRPYQAEAFDAARKTNVVMVGATGVGKTLVSLMLIRDFYFEDARRREPETDTRRWCVFLCPTQELVFQQAKCAEKFTGVRCGSFVGKYLDDWGLTKWRHEMDTKEVLVMTPNAFLKLLHRGKEYLSLADVGVLVFDECHQARKKHPYARVMEFYKDLQENGGPLPKVFGMTASPTAECVEVLRCKAYVCEDSLIENYQANAEVELLRYPVRRYNGKVSFTPSPTVVEEIEAMMRMLFADPMCGSTDSKERFVVKVVEPVLLSYQHLGLWCAVRHAVIFCETFLRIQNAQGMRRTPRILRVEKVVNQLIQKLNESPLGLAVACGTEPPLTTPATSATSKDSKASKRTPEAEVAGGTVNGNPAHGVLETKKPGETRAPFPLSTRNSTRQATVVAVAAPADRCRPSRAVGDGRVEEEGEDGLGGGVVGVDVEGGSNGGGDVAAGSRVREAAVAGTSEGDRGWGITPGRVTMLVKTIAEADCWAGKGEHLRCMVFVERRTTAMLLCEYLSHCLNGRLNCGFVVGRSNSRDSSFLRGNRDGHDAADELEEEGALDDRTGGLGTRKLDTSRGGVGEHDHKAKKNRVDESIHLFRVGELQVLVTTDACSEGIDVPECNLVIAMDKIKNSRSLIHTRGRARSKGGKFVIMVEDQDQAEQERILQILRESESIKKFQLDFEKSSLRVPLRQAHPNMVHRIERSGAVVDMDMATCLLFKTLSAVGCDFHPLLVVEDSIQPGSYKCRLELPSFLDIGTIDTDSIPGERFSTKLEARSAVCYLALLKMLEKGYIDERLDPSPKSDRLAVENRKTFDPVVSSEFEVRESREKATLPVPRPIAMGILPTPAVDVEQARLAAWEKHAKRFLPDAEWGKSAIREKASQGGVDVIPSEDVIAGEGVETVAAARAAAAGGTVAFRASVIAPSGERAIHAGAEESTDREKGVSSASESAPPMTTGDDSTAAWEDAKTPRGCYEGVPGPKRRMRVYCFRSPPGELNGWVPSSNEPRVRRATARGYKRSASGKEGEDKSGGAKGDEDNEALKGKPAEEDGEDGGDDEVNLPTFNPKLGVDVGQGPGIGLGPRLYVGLVSAAPLPLTAAQADKVGIEDSFDVDLNPAQLAAIVQWHRETLGMVALYKIPHQLTRTPQMDPEKCPFRNAGEVGDKGVVAVPVEFVETSGGGGGAPRIDWAAIEAANAGMMQPSSDTDEEYARRILFARANHKTCRFYFVLERTSTTLGDYLQQRLESTMVVRGVHEHDYEAACKSQRLLLGVPVPALRHPFVQHLIRGERTMDPDAGVRRRVLLSQRAGSEKPGASIPEDEATNKPEGVPDGVYREGYGVHTVHEVDETNEAEDDRDDKDDGGGRGRAGGEGIEGWAGVSTLKSNKHGVQTTRPVLLLEQYTQVVCMTRQVFVSVMHIVPRMFDLERQLLCFVLHEAVFLPALQASLWHRCPLLFSNASNDSDQTGTQADESPGTKADASLGTQLIPDDASIGDGSATSMASPSPAQMSGKVIDASLEGDATRWDRKLSADTTEALPASPPADDSTVPSGAEAIHWPPNGVWNAPGGGGGIACGPVRTMTSDRGGDMGRGGEAKIEAAAVGVVQWQGGSEGAVADTLSLLDCSLRRPINERLETLGDAWLNFYAAFVIFQDKPVIKEEGMMTFLRKNIVCNARLIKCADGRGLREFIYPPRTILGRSFEMWLPSLLPLPPAVEVNQKIIADVVEALLGAALVAGGNRSAAFLMEWLGLPTLEASNNPDKPLEQQQPREPEIDRDDDPGVADSDSSTRPSEPEGIKKGEDCGDEGNASDVARKLSAGVNMNRGASRRRAPLSDHAPEVHDKARPWLWKPPAYMRHVLEWGSTGFGDLDKPHERGVSRRNDRTGAGSRTIDCPGDRGTGRVVSSSDSSDSEGTVEPKATASRESDEVMASERRACSERRSAHAVSVSRSPSPSVSPDRKTADERSRSPDAQQEPITRKDSPAGEGVSGEGEERRQEREHNTELLLEGLKGSARWPIRREPLMSVGFLVDTGVLPKVYMTTKPSARLMGSIGRLEQELSYTFKHPWLCIQAITHPSWTMFDRTWKHSIADDVVDQERAGGGSRAEPATVPAQDYQRLEFLGDAVLGWLVTTHLYFASSTFTPAELTIIKASCVCNSSLWLIAIKLNIHHVLRASPKILENIHAFIENQDSRNTWRYGKSSPPKHPADVLEALIGAVFLDSSCCMETVSRVFWPLIAQYLLDHPHVVEDIT